MHKKVGIMSFYQIWRLPLSLLYDCHYAGTPFWRIPLLISSTGPTVSRNHQGNHLYVIGWQILREVRAEGEYNDNEWLGFTTPALSLHLSVGNVHRSAAIWSHEGWLHCFCCALCGTRWHVSCTCKNTRTTWEADRHHPTPPWRVRHPPSSFIFPTLKEWANESRGCAVHWEWEQWWRLQAPSEAD